MIGALLKGKLSRDQENMEDILTSCVFGLLRLADPQHGLFPFLAQAKAESGEQPLLGLGATVSHDQIKVDYEFWPRWEHCEPDVAISIRQPDAIDWLVAVEAKYRSGKSSEADDEAEHVNDQLAKEWLDLVFQAEKSASQPVLVYLTADFALPRDEFGRTFEELRSKGGGEASKATICWLSWRHLRKLKNGQPCAAVCDLQQLAERLGLIFFEGISPIDSVHAAWTFESSSPTWNLSVDKFSCDWGFTS